MRAGLLSEIIAIHQERKTISETGAELKEYVETHKIKAFRKKLTASVGNGINANEEFIENTLVFQVRKYSFIDDNVRVKHGNTFYRIILLDPQRDNTYLMTLSKINE